MKLLKIAALTLLAQTTAAMAATTTYECKVNTSSSHLGWVPEVVFIAHPAGSKTATVSDPIILYYNDRQPLSGKLAVDNAKRRTFSWTVQGKSKSNQRVKVQYRATIQKCSSELNISAMPLGYANSFVAQGTCKLGQLKS